LTTDNEFDYKSKSQIRYSVRSPLEEVDEDLKSTSSQIKSQPRTFDDQCDRSSVQMPNEQTRDLYQLEVAPNEFFWNQYKSDVR